MYRKFRTFSTYDDMNKWYGEVVHLLAENNNVNVYHVNEETVEDYYFKYGSPSAADIFILDGNLEIYENSNAYELSLHELLHILSVPPEYRYLMNNDTEKSYKAIKKLVSDKDRIMTESAVLGAQAILFKKFGVCGSLHGSFFSGNLHKYDRHSGESITDVKSEWMKRGEKLLSKLNLEGIFDV